MRVGFHIVEALLTARWSCQGHVVHGGVLRDVSVTMAALQMRKEEKCIQDQMAAKRRRDQRDRGQPFTEEVEAGYGCDGGQQVGGALIPRTVSPSRGQRFLLTRGSTTRAQKAGWGLPTQDGSSVITADGSLFLWLMNEWLSASVFHTEACRSTWTHSIYTSKKTQVRNLS